MGFPRQEYWSGLLCLLPGHLPDSGIEPVSLTSPALAGGFFTIVPPGKPPNNSNNSNDNKNYCVTGTLLRALYVTTHLIL